MNNKAKNRVIIISISIAVTLFAVLTALQQNAPSGAQSGLLQPASLEAFQKRIQASSGQVILVNLWASWCEPCKVEFPALLELSKSFGAQGLDLVLVSLDNEEQRQEADQFLQSQQVSFPSLFKGSEKTGFLSPVFPQWSGAIPASFLINKDLQVLESWIGETNLKQFQDKIVQHLPKP